MNSFENDFYRAVFSWKFLVGMIIEFLVLLEGGFDGELFYMSVPLVCTLPYSCGWLDEYKNGYVKASLPRTKISSYILGKFFGCIISGGLCELLGAAAYMLLKGEESRKCDLLLLFLCAALWAAVANILATLSNSKCVAYGGSFIVFYFLVILHDRYWENLYCLYPYEWIKPEHIWIFDETGVSILLCGFITVTALIYYLILKRRIQSV